MAAMLLLAAFSRQVTGFSPSPVARPMTLTAGKSRPSTPAWNPLFSPSSATKLSTSSSSDSDNNVEKESKSINDLLSELGTSFQNRAEQNAKKCKEADTRKNKILYGVVSTFYYLLFLLYRSYRGFFVLLPAVFRRVYAKMEVAMKDGVLEEDVKEINGSDDETKMTWKTKITVAVCSAVVTMSYVLGALGRTLVTFFKSLKNTKSIPDSFGAVAEEMSREDKKEKVKNETKDDKPNDRLYP
eukprot:CAMPEP_0176031744 /NCGR_PEP_ID=MMETSP0120_2-20121206/15655_1 /TAXON_ID=160619 /ORGANISM="Kryptoperidinium foliaceum, Strain CCMP 1326" /LENGTH=241 /DNA_ID=CAMNT_0017365043 /DNA_START=197 /DNA_END=922 /DNA_ORIENTATION=+